MPRTDQEQISHQVEISLDMPPVFVYTNTRCMGRPRKTESSRRSKLFPLRLTPGEFACYEQAARKLGVTVAEMLRKGADLYIQTRGKGGSSKKETQT